MIRLFVPPPAVDRHSQPTISVTLWRCTKCGKWSHAKRRPKRHHRFIADADATERPPDAERIFSDWNIDGSIRDGGWRVPCGPFEKWEAWKVG